MTGRLHVLHPSGDAEQDGRRLEQLAWQHYVRVSKTLASLPLTSSNLWQSWQCVERAKAAFAQAWRALDEVIQ